MHWVGHKDMFCNSQLTHEIKTGNRKHGEIAAMWVNRMQSEVIRGIVQNVYFGNSHKAQRIGNVPSACCNIWKARWRRKRRREGERQVFTYIGWEGLQGGEGLLRIRGLSLGEKGLQTRASFIHRHGAARPCRQVAFQGRGGGRGGRGGGTGGIGVVRAAGGLIGLLSGDLPPERAVLALQRLQLKRNTSKPEKRREKQKL